MRAALKYGFIILAAEDAEERENMDELARDVAGEVFTLQISSDKGYSPRDLGPCEAACREPINIVFSAVEEQWRSIGAAFGADDRLRARSGLGLQCSQIGLRSKSAKAWLNKNQARRTA